MLDEEEMEDERHKTKKSIKQKVKLNFQMFNLVMKKMQANNQIFQLAKPGQKLQLSDGAGKTAIVNLLMRFYEIDQGDISIDGYHSKITENFEQFCILQDTWVFEVQFVKI